MDDRTLTPHRLGSLEACVCFNLRRFNRSVTQFYDRALRAAGLKVTQLPILAGLAARESARMAEFSEWLGMDRTTLLRNLQPLSRAGLVRLARGADGRRSEIRLTDAGRKVLARAYPLWEKAQRRVLASLGARRWKALRRDLAAATDKLA